VYVHRRLRRGLTASMRSRSKPLDLQNQGRTRATCNNVAAPAVIGKYLHVGTTAGYYYVLDRNTGKWSARSIAKGADLLGPRRRGCIASISPRSAPGLCRSSRRQIAWTWDFVKEVVNSTATAGAAKTGRKEREGRVDWKDHFVCSRDICLVGKTVVIPAGGRTVFLDDAGTQPKLRAVGVIPAYDGREYPATFGQSADAAGNVYVQWHRRDNAGRVEILRPDPGPTARDETRNRLRRRHANRHQLPGLLSFAPVAIRGEPTSIASARAGLGLVPPHQRPAPPKNWPSPAVPTSSPTASRRSCDAPSIAPPVLTATTPSTAASTASSTSSR
jgi:hypothetical protein